jgi:hypothetical protein
MKLKHILEIRTVDVSKKLQGSSPVTEFRIPYILVYIGFGRERVHRKSTSSLLRIQSSET